MNIGLNFTKHFHVCKMSMRILNEIRKSLLFIFLYRYNEILNSSSSKIVNFCKL